MTKMNFSFVIALALTSQLSAQQSADVPCISVEQYRAIEQECAVNVAALGLEKQQTEHGGVVTTLEWPIRAAKDVKDCEVYFIGAYVDHEKAAGAVKDFDCGAHTYDGHHGTDIAAWPYGFYKMDNNMVEVVAAAPGTIIQKADGNFDRNCVGVGSSAVANSIIIQHADGSRALYWHMKRNSITTKEPGETVERGEYLGVVGSSGSSSGPHLHFEVWTSSLNTSYIDPFAGECNSLNAESWWQTQKPHTNPAIMKVSVNTTDNVFPPCPETETPNEAEVFIVPFQGANLAPGFAKFYIFMRDDGAGRNAECKIINPDGSDFTTFLYTGTVAYNASYYGFSKRLPVTPGEYTFHVTYAGTTCSTVFTIQSAVSVNKDPIVDMNCTTCTMDLYNMMGQLIAERIPLTQRVNVGHTILPGWYFYRVVDERSNVVRSGIIPLQ